MQNSTIDAYKFREYQGETRKCYDFDGELCVYSKQSASEFHNLLNLIDIYIFGTKPYKKVLIDFTDTTRITAIGALALFTFITSVQLRTNDHSIIKIILPKDEYIQKLFRKSGLWEAIKPGTERKLDKLRFTQNPFQSGYDPDVHLEPIIEQLEASLKKKFPLKLKEAINESILNIVQHAYLKSETKTRWWHYAHISQDKTKLIFCIADRGMSIFKKFPDLQYLRQSIVIKYAMTKGNSSTGLHYRGKGSKNIKKPVEIDADDKLIIVSGNGVYKYFERDKEPEIYDLKSSFKGTILAWEFDLS